MFWHREYQFEVKWWSFCVLCVLLYLNLPCNCFLKIPKHYLNYYVLFWSILVKTVFRGVNVHALVFLLRHIKTKAQFMALHKLANLTASKPFIVSLLWATGLWGQSAQWTVTIAMAWDRGPWEPMVQTLLRVEMKSWQQLKKNPKKQKSHTWDFKCLFNIVSHLQLMRFINMKYITFQGLIYICIYIWYISD